jgi:hypothetical protein
VVKRYRVHRAGRGHKSTRGRLRKRDKKSFSDVDISDWNVDLHSDLQIMRQNRRIDKQLRARSLYRAQRGQPGQLAKERRAKKREHLQPGYLTFNERLDKKFNELIEKYKLQASINAENDEDYYDMVQSIDPAKYRRLARKLVVGLNDETFKQEVNAKRLLKRHRRKMERVREHREYALKHHKKSIYTPNNQMKKNKAFMDDQVDKNTQNEELKQARDILTKARVRHDFKLKKKKEKKIMVKQAMDQSAQIQLSNARELEQQHLSLNDGKLNGSNDRIFEVLGSDDLTEYKEHLEKIYQTKTGRRLLAANFESDMKTHYPVHDFKELVNLMLDRESMKEVPNYLWSLSQHSSYLYRVMNGQIQLGGEHIIINNDKLNGGSRINKDCHCSGCTGSLHHTTYDSDGNEIEHEEPSRSDEGYDAERISRMSSEEHFQEANDNMKLLRCNDENAKWLQHFVDLITNEQKTAPTFISDNILSHLRLGILESLTHVKERLQQVEEYHGSIDVKHQLVTKHEIQLNTSDDQFHVKHDSLAVPYLKRRFGCVDILYQGLQLSSKLRWRDVKNGKYTLVYEDAYSEANGVKVKVDKLWHLLPGDKYSLHAVIGMVLSKTPTVKCKLHHHYGFESTLIDIEKRTTISKCTVYLFHKFLDCDDEPAHIGNVYATTKPPQHILDIINSVSKNQVDHKLLPGAAGTGRDEKGNGPVLSKILVCIFFFVPTYCTPAPTKSPTNNPTSSRYPTRFMMPTITHPTVTITGRPTKAAISKYPTVATRDANQAWAIGCFNNNGFINFINNGQISATPTDCDILTATFDVSYSGNEMTWTIQQPSLIFAIIPNVVSGHAMNLGIVSMTGGLECFSEPTIDFLLFCKSEAVEELVFSIYNVDYNFTGNMYIAVLPYNNLFNCGFDISSIAINKNNWKDWMMTNKGMHAVNGNMNRGQRNKFAGKLAKKIVNAAPKPIRNSLKNSGAEKRIKNQIAKNAPKVINRGIRVVNKRMGTKIKPVSKRFVNANWTTRNRTKGTPTPGAGSSTKPVFFTHTEMFDKAWSAGGDYYQVTYPINPGIPNLHKMISNIAPSFMGYRIRRMRITYKPLGSWTSTTGQLIIAYNADPDDKAGLLSNATELEDLYNVTKHSPSNHQLATNNLTIIFNPMNGCLVPVGKVQSIRTGAVNTSLRDYDYGTIAIGTQGGVTDQYIGSLFVVYTYELVSYNPVPQYPQLTYTGTYIKNDGTGSDMTVKGNNNPFTITMNAVNLYISFEYQRPMAGNFSFVITSANSQYNFPSTSVKFVSWDTNSEKFAQSIIYNLGTDTTGTAMVFWVRGTIGDGFDIVFAEQLFNCYIEIQYCLNQYDVTNKYNPSLGVGKLEMPTTRNQTSLAIKLQEEEVLNHAVTRGDTTNLSCLMPAKRHRGRCMEKGIVEEKKTEEKLVEPLDKAPTSVSRFEQLFNFGEEQSYHSLSAPNPTGDQEENYVSANRKNGLRGGMNTTSADTVVIDTLDNDSKLCDWCQANPCVCKNVNNNPMPQIDVAQSNNVRNIPVINQQDLTSSNASQRDEIDELFEPRQMIYDGCKFCEGVIVPSKKNEKRGECDKGNHFYFRNGHRWIVDKNRRASMIRRSDTTACPNCRQSAVVRDITEPICIDCGIQCLPKGDVAKRPRLTVKELEREAKTNRCRRCGTVCEKAYCGNCDNCRNCQKTLAPGWRGYFCLKCQKQGINTNVNVEASSSTSEQSGSNKDTSNDVKSEIQSNEAIPNNSGKVKREKPKKKQQLRDNSNIEVKVRNDGTTVSDEQEKVRMEYKVAFIITPTVQDNINNIPEPIVLSKYGNYYDLPIIDCSDDDKTLGYYGDKLMQVLGYRVTLTTIAWAGLIDGKRIWVVIVKGYASLGALQRPNLIDNRTHFQLSPFKGSILIDKANRIDKLHPQGYSIDFFQSAISGNRLQSVGPNGMMYSESLECKLEASNSDQQSQYFVVKDIPALQLTDIETAFNNGGHFLLRLQDDCIGQYETTNVKWCHTTEYAQGNMPWHRYPLCHIKTCTELDGNDLLVYSSLWVTERFWYRQRAPPWLTRLWPNSQLWLDWFNDIKIKTLTWFDLLGVQQLTAFLRRYIQNPPIKELQIVRQYNGWALCQFNNTTVQLPIGRLEPNTKAIVENDGNWHKKVYDAKLITELDLRATGTTNTSYNQLLSIGRRHLQREIKLDDAHSKHSTAIVRQSVDYVHKLMVRREQQTKPLFNKRNKFIVVGISCYVLRPVIKPITRSILKFAFQRLGNVIDNVVGVCNSFLTTHKGMHTTNGNINWNACFQQSVCVNHNDLCNPWKFEVTGKYSQPAFGPRMVKSRFYDPRGKLNFPACQYLHKTNECSCITKTMRGYYNLHLPPDGYDFFSFQSCDENLMSGLSQRYFKKQPIQDPTTWLSIDENINDVYKKIDLAIKLNFENNLKPSFNKWVSRYPIAKQRQLREEREKEWRPLPKAFRSSDIFVKFEGNLKKSGYIDNKPKELKPRIIFGVKPQDLIRDGPVMLAVKERMKVVFNGINSPFIFGACHNPQHLGQLLEQALPGNQIRGYEADLAECETTNRGLIKDLENESLKVFGVNKHCRQQMFRAIRCGGRSMQGNLSFTMPDVRMSGEPQTTVGNTLNYLVLLWASLNNVGITDDQFTCVISGDDCALFVNHRVDHNKVLQAYKLVTNCGLKPEVIARETWNGTSFFSGYFVHLADKFGNKQLVLIPKIGRSIHKNMTVKQLFDFDPDVVFSQTVLARTVEWSGIPILDELNQYYKKTYYPNVKPVKVPKILTSQSYFWDLDNYEMHRGWFHCCQETIIEICNIYNISVELLQQMREAATVGTPIHTDLLLEIDL